VIIDAVRTAKVALDRGIGGPVESAAAYFMKSPPRQLPEDEARARLEAFLRGDLER
jgi:myo-inositol-1-phosphate synthase